MVFKKTTEDTTTRTTSNTWIPIKKPGTTNEMDVDLAFIEESEQCMEFGTYLH